MTHRRGFTLVELLATIAILGLLLALLLPAVQAARESSRRTACSNKLKQLSLGVLNYERNFDVFPAAYSDPDLVAKGANGGMFSFLVSILPFLEEQALADATGRYVERGARPWDRGVVGGVSCPFLSQPAVLLCPSDPTRPAGNATLTNYRCNRGDVWTGSNNRTTDQADLTDPRFVIRRRGPFGSGDVSRCRSGHITDGMSNTIMLSELAVGTARNSHPGGIANLGTLGWSSRPNTCSSLLGASGYTVSVYSSSVLGGSWPDGRNANTAFFTVLPPQSANCGNSAGTGVWAGTVSSYHDRGVFVAMCDGATRFITDSIDAGDPAKTPNVTGQSQWGIWGAMGTTAGGEMALLE